jgi:cysteine desulfurase
MIYLDYQSTTPLAPEVRTAMLQWLDTPANPHAAHKMGRKAAAAIAYAKAQILQLLPPDGALYFTSGATEAIHWAVQSAARCEGEAWAVSTEHSAVLAALQALPRAHTTRFMPVDSLGLVQLPNTAPRLSLLSAMLVNNEIGTIQPVERLADFTHAQGGLLLCDAVQGYGRVAIPHNVDYVALAAHKIHGPIGIGALWVRAGAPLHPLFYGGGQQEGMRSGTLSPALCAGFGQAAQLMAERWEQDKTHVAALFALMQEQLGATWCINGTQEQRYLGNINIGRTGFDVARLMSEERNLLFSAGSACASGSGHGSHVLRALGLGAEAVNSSLRLGFGRYTTQQEIITAAHILNAAAHRQGL